jgi:hypothetical protein
MKYLHYITTIPDPLVVSYSIVEWMGCENIPLLNHVLLLLKLSGPGSLSLQMESEHGVTTAITMTHGSGSCTGFRTRKSQNEDR